MAIAKPTGGEIRAGTVYSLPDFRRITGLGAKSVRRAAREGLKIRRQGRNAFILGDDWIAHLSKAVG